MSRPSVSLPVHVEPALRDVIRGVFEIEGLLHLDADRGALTLEYQTNSSLGRTQIETVTLERDDVARCEVQRRFWGHRVLLYPARLSSFDGVPGVDEGRLVLAVRRAHRDTLEVFDRSLHTLELPAGTTPPPALVEAAPVPLPFRISSVHLGLSHATGMLSFDEDFVVLDVQVIALGLVKHEPFQVRVERSVIRGARLSRGLRHDRLCLTPSKFELLAAMPGRHRDVLRLDVHRRHRTLAERVVKALR